MAEGAAPPQHVLDTRYLHELSQRLLPPKRRPKTRPKRGGAAKKVGWDLEDAAQKRWCDCDPDERWEEGFDEDSDEEDRWFCLYRSIKDQYGMHTVLEQARLNIEADLTEFPKAIYEEIVERCNLEHTKVLEAQARKHAPSDEPIQAPPSPSPPHACILPSFSFQKLPAEILAEIALLAQESDPHVHIKLSHVDTSLRAFVNSTPLLWTRVDFLYPLNTVHHYLERSADVPLRVTALLPLHTNPPYYTTLPSNRVLQGINFEDENTRLEEFLRALRPHRHRIISLRLRSHDLMFEVPGGDEQQTLAYDFLWDGSMVKLELLDLELDRWTWKGIEALPLSYPVKELHLHRSWTVEYIPLFSSSLRSLVITDDRAEFPIIFDALQATPRLTSLTFRDMSFVWTAEKEEVTVNLDQLESLSLVRVVGSAAETLLNCIAAPNLTSIALHLVDTTRFISDGTDINLNELRLSPVPRPSVRLLDLTACDGGPSFFASTFKAFPCLTHLRIASSNLSEDHLLPLAVKSDSYPERQHGFQAAACPNLKHLTIDNEFNDITEVILQMAQLRYTLGSPLESVTLRGIPAGSGLVHGVLRLDEHVAKIELGEFDQEVGVYGDSDDGSPSETNSEGDWASGDEEIVKASRKVGGAVYGYCRLVVLFCPQK